MVAFSGGRDSSAMLAAATATARHAGLPDPIPLTMRFAAHPRTDESEWQEVVIRHLGLRDRAIICLDDELDLLGPLATSLLRRHGLYWPPNAHTLALLMREATRGALVTGNGGDEVMFAWQMRRIMEIRSLRSRPRLGEIEHVALSVAPRWLRRLAWRARNPLRLHWLSVAGGRQLAWAVAGRWAEHPAAWGDQVRYVLGSRSLRLASTAFGAFARDCDVRLVEPFLDPRFALAVVAAMPSEGPASRAAALEACFGDLLPRESTRRSTKAAFTEVFWGPESRRFADAWDGSGVDGRLVYADALRAEWAKTPPDMRSMTALQAAWLADQA